MTFEKPNVQQYELGGGKIYFAELDASGNPTKAFREAGNAPSITLTMDSETYEHFSSTGMTKVKDLTRTISQSLSGATTLENFLTENVEMFFAGSSTEIVNPAVAGLTAEPLLANADIIIGGYAQLRSGGTQVIMNFDKTNLTVKAGATTLVEGTDYNVDALTGLVEILSSTTIDTIIAGTDDLVFDLTADPTAPAIKTVDLLTQDSVIRAIKIVLDADQQETNKEQMVIDLNNVTISPDGDFEAISLEEVKSLGFSFDANEDNNGKFGSISYKKIVA